jgi:hypothetical protein
MHQELSERGWKFEVWFMADSEPNRQWTFIDSEFSFPHCPSRRASEGRLAIVARQSRGLQSSAPASPRHFARSWLMDNSDGLDCEPIPGTGQKDLLVGVALEFESTQWSSRPLGTPFHAERIPRVCSTGNIVGEVRYESHAKGSHL